MLANTRTMSVSYTHLDVYKRQIHDIQGRMVARNKISQLSNEITVPEFTGIAIITILNDNKIWESKKVLIMK